MIDRIKTDRSHLAVNKNLFTSVEDLYETLEAYLAWLENNPIRINKIYGKHGEIKEVDYMHAPTLEGFGLYCRCTLRYLKDVAERNSDFREAFDFINQAIFHKSYAAAAAGALKEAIVTRKLGLADKVEVKRTERKIIEFQMPDNGRIEEATYELLE
jgi:hypothetical protein